MEVDLVTLTRPATLEADVCIVGAGPAGMSLAHALAATGQEVVLLESGGRRATGWSEELNQGPSHGDPYAGLAVTRQRQLGGTARLWNTPIRGKAGAKYVPLDPADLAGHSADPDGAWPFERTALEPWYRRAQVLCGLGPFEYGSDYWVAPQRPCFEFAAGTLRSAVYQFGLARPFTGAYLRELHAARKVRVCSHATVCELRTDAAQELVVEARVLAPNGTETLVRARHFVLAGGAVENARLLLLARLGNRSGWVGRCFMEHPRDSALTLFPSDPRFAARAAFYDLHRARDGIFVCGRVTLAAPPQADGLPNASVTLLPLWGSPTNPFRHRLAQWARGRPARPPEGYGWSRPPVRAGEPPAFRLLVNLEQRPHPENRIVLADARDRFGLPRAELHWHWREEEQRGLARLRELISLGFEAARLGRVHIAAEQRPDPNAHHQAGTTRMHRDPRLGVVDAECRVHGTRNLYVAGASVFPSAGFANPTLTIVALALRLADRLARPE